VLLQVTPNTVCSVHATGGTHRARMGLRYAPSISVKAALSRPAYQHVTRAVGRWQKIQNENNFSGITEQE
jgi:hypothetical protein